jgi:putative membrane protein
MIAWTKAIHIGAIMVWCGGLLVLPMIFAQRAGLRGEPLHELHRFARSVFIHVTSPAAFAAVAAGILLIFLRDVFTAWMALKLVAVGLLVALHIRQGYIIQHLFNPGGKYARWRQHLGVGSTLLVITAVLVLVLAKPNVEVEHLPDWALRPGGLQSLLETRIPIP